MAADTSALEQSARAYYLAVGQRVADEFVRELREAAPKHAPTQNAIKATVRYGAGSLFIDLVADTDVAQFTNKGTRPHRISARNRRAISFTVGMTRVAVKYVDHPGTTGTHWWDNVLARRSDIIRRALA